jgi:hypothetical protein
VDFRVPLLVKVVGLMVSVPAVLLSITPLFTQPPLL